MEIIPFEDRIPTIQREILKRRKKWTLSTLSWDDASQLIMIRVFKKYHLFDPNKGEFTHWLNRLISSAIKNIFRDYLTIHSRPCILGCAFNIGGNLGDEFCAYTKSGKQCEECPIYAIWAKKKKDHFNVAQTLPLTNHEQEVNNMQCDFIDIEESKKILEKKLKEKLNNFEWQIYDMLYIKNITMKEVGLKLKYKKNANSDIPGYQQLKKIQKHIIKIAKQIIAEEEL